MIQQLFRAIGIVLFASLTFSGSVLGQKSYALELGGGASIPVGKLGDVQDTGYNGIVALAIGAPNIPIGVRFDGTYNNFRDRPSGSTAPNLRTVGVLGNLLLVFPSATAKPYIVAGGGIYNTKSNAPDTKSENSFGFNAGLGMTFGVGPFATFVESRYHSISRKAANGGVMQFVPVTIGLLF
jgi:hypothetical protein